ncbi:hypothetical protein NBRC116493_14990 [Aurantivibrio infirmus]
MSKLETAFSKALKEQAAQGAQGDTDSENTRNIGGLPQKTGDDLKELVSVRNQIKKMTDKGNLLSDIELANKRLVYPRMKDKDLLNIYRNLRTKLLSISGNRNFVTLVTSVVSGGGSSLVSANIAATFAFDEGKTALLIEGNVHSPSLGKLFELDPSSLGLMECLESDEISVRDVLHETGIPRLRFIPSGKSRENSAEYFTSDRMREVVSEVSARYPERFPIIDAPSLQDSADTRILLDLCDQVVLVVPYGLCTREEIKEAANAIGANKLAGVVLNQF